MSRTGSRVGSKPVQKVQPDEEDPMTKDRSTPINLLNRFLSLSQRGRRTRTTKDGGRLYDSIEDASPTSSSGDPMDFASASPTAAASNSGFVSLPSSPSLVGSGRPTTRQQKRPKKTGRSSTTTNTNDLLLSHHPALIQDPKPITYVVTKVSLDPMDVVGDQQADDVDKRQDSCDGELVLTLDRNGVLVTMVTGLNDEGQLTRRTLLSVPWYRVKSYEKHIKGHRFALVFQSGRDKVGMKRVVYNTDESARIFQAVKRYIAWVAYHS